MSNDLLQLVCALRDYLLFGTPQTRTSLVKVLDELTKEKDKHVKPEKTVPRVKVHMPDGSIHNAQFKKQMCVGDALLSAFVGTRYCVSVEDEDGECIIPTDANDELAELKLIEGDSVFVRPVVKGGCVDEDCECRNSMK